MGISKLEAIFSKNHTKKSAVAFSALMGYQFERRVIMLERVSRSELSAQESVLKELESAARELEADYTALMTKTKRYADKNDVLENDLVVVRSQFEHESKENEMLLLKLNELKLNEMAQIEETAKLSRELKRMSDVEDKNKYLSEQLEDQRDQLDLMKRKVEEYIKISTSVQFYKNKISLQNEQIVSLQEKLRESASDIFHANTSPPSDVLYTTSPANTRSADLTYTSSSLRGLQQAVDRSNMLRSRRTSDVSQISNGDSTRRRRDLIASRR
jgi:chromosome segregation ATPase